MLLIGHCSNFVKGDVLLIACEVMVRCQKQQAMTLFALTHGHTGAIPIGSLNFSRFIFVVATGTKG